MIYSILIICFILCCISVLLFYKTKTKENNINKEITGLRNKLKLLKTKKECIEKQTKILQEENENKKNTFDKIIKSTLESIEELKLEKEEIKNQTKELRKEKELAAEALNAQKSILLTAKNNYVETLEKDYIKAEEHYDLEKAKLEDDCLATQTKIKNLKDSLSAAVKAYLEEEERNKQIEFYKLHISNKELSDISKIKMCRDTLNQPVILNKVIWSAFFQKQTNELCDRILDKDTVCGIYKITNIQTKQCYVGQSKNIAERWKQHIKCGCGINAPASNKLYNDMQDYGVWNFTFELLEKCDQKLLNEKEKFFIDLYQSNRYSNYNMTKGNK